MRMLDTLTMYTVKEAADSLGLATSTLHAQIRAGVLKATKRGGVLWIAPAEVELYRVYHRRAGKA